MKKDIHPKYNKIKVRLTDGTEYETRSTLGAKEGFTLQLEIDPTCHPAYTGEHRILDSNQISKHKEKYGDLVY